MNSVYLTPELQKQFPFFAHGSATIKAVVSAEKDKFLALASLADLNRYIPNIDSAQNVDLLGIAFNLFVANRANNNDDVSDAETSVALAKLFINKPINIEHKRDRVVGVTLSYAFTHFGTNQPMTEEEALASKDPFNVTLGGVIWKVVSPKLAELIEDASDPASENYGKVSASWEVGFLDFVIAEMGSNSKNLSDATLITDPNEIQTRKDYMKAYGGKGSKNGKKLYRLIKGDSLPLGVGLTCSPAADVKGVATEPEEEDETQGTQASQAEPISAENISQTKEIVVIEERKTLGMKITKIEDITDDLLKQAKASEVTEWVKEQLAAANKAYQEEKNGLESQVKASKDATDKLTGDLAKVQEDLKKATDALASLNAEKEARAKQDAFNSRMGALDEEFALTDAEREVIAADIASLDDTAFAAYHKKLGVLLAAKKKANQSLQKDDNSGRDQNGKDMKVPNKDGKVSHTECKASEQGASPKTTVEAAIDNAEGKKETIPAAAAAAQPASMMEKAAQAFGVDQWISDIKLTEK